MTLEELKKKYVKMFLEAHAEVCGDGGMDGDSTGANVARLGRIMELAEKRKWELVEEYGRSEYTRGLKDGQR